MLRGALPPAVHPSAGLNPLSNSFKLFFFLTMHSFFNVGSGCVPPLDLKPVSEYETLPKVTK